MRRHSPLLVMPPMPSKRRPTEPRSILQGAGFYSDEYVKQDGEWKIKHTGYERTFEHITPYVEGPGVTLRTRWDS